MHRVSARALGVERSAGPCSAGWQPTAFSWVQKGDCGTVMANWTRMKAPHSVNAPHFGRTVNAPHFGRKLNENVKWNQRPAPCDCYYYAIQKFIAFRDFTWGSANCPGSEKGSAICPSLG